MAPTNATVPMEKKVEPMEETKESMICVNGCTQSIDKLLKGNAVAEGKIEGVENGKSGNDNGECPKGCSKECCSKNCCTQCKCCGGNNESVNAAGECPKGCTKACCSKQCCAKCSCCEKKESNNADQECPKGCTKACCSNKCCLQCACCAKDDEEIAMEHLALGKRNFLTGEMNIASDSLAMAADILRTRHGEMAIECIDANMYYGKSLLELSRMESNVLQNGLKDCPLEDEQMNEDSRIEDPEKCTDEEKQKVSEIVGEALNENFQACLTIINKKSLEKEAPKPSGDESKKTGNSDEQCPKGCSMECCSKNCCLQCKCCGSNESANDGEECPKGCTQACCSKQCCAKCHCCANTESANADHECPKGCTKECCSKQCCTQCTCCANNEGQDAQQDEEMEEEGDEPEAMEQEMGNDTVQNDADEPSNLQRAWELFELNRIILGKELTALDTKEDPEKQEKKKDLNLRISDTLFLLAEVSLESENFSQALDDFNSCLEMRKSLLPSDSRLIAETLYQLGLAQEYHQQYDEAVGSMNSAIDVLKKRIANLSADEEATEIKEIEALVPGIVEKINDIKEIKAEEERHKKAKLDGNNDAPDSFASQISSSKEAAPISSNLIKKKENPEA